MKRIGKFGLLIVILAGLYFLGRSLGLDPSEFTPEKIRVWIGSFGPIAPVVFIVVYAAAPLLFFPGAALSVAAGLAFGWKLGFLCVLIGANLCANAAFGLARWLGRDLAAKLARGKLAALDEKAAAHGFQTIFTLRLIPLVPFNALNYGAGLSGVSWRAYAAGTLLGMVPGIFGFVYLGGNLHPRAWEFWLALALLAMLAALPSVYRKWKTARGSHNL